MQHLKDLIQQDTFFNMAMDPLLQEQFELPWNEYKRLLCIEDIQEYVYGIGIGAIIKTAMRFLENIQKLL